MYPRAVVGCPARLAVFLLIAPLAMLVVRGEAPAAERYAFLVGVRQYDKTQLNDLQFSENDVTRLSTTLQEAGYSKRNIVLMTQSVGVSNARLAPFCKNIQKELALMLRECQAGDSVLLAFSGHGVQLAGDAESYFCPADANLQDRATLIPLGDVFKSLEASKAAVKILLVDACRNDPVSSLGKSRRVVDLETLSRQAPPTPPGGIAAFFSCSKGEQSFEHPDLKHGIFFHFLIQGLSGKADFDKDQQISLAELELYAVKEVQSYSRIELGAAQTPERRGESRGLVTLVALVRPVPSLPGPVQRPDPVAGQPLVNSIGMKLAWIPAGELQMGSTAAQVSRVLKFDSSFKKEYNGDEQPQHKVRITKPFYLGVHEVTKGQFALFVQEQGYKTEPERDGQGGYGYNQVEGKFEGLKPQYSWRNTGVTQPDSHPVVNVTSNDAVAFAQWLSLKEQRTYRLPTEAEWEYACRAGTQTLYQYGDNPEGLAFVGNVADGTAKAKFSNWDAIAAKDGYVFTAPVGRFHANAFGLFDMHGNAWEWCSDLYDSAYYKNSPPTDPSGAATGSGQVIRGGSWNRSAGYCRSANRAWNEPSHRGDRLGFRVALNASSK